MTDHNPAYIDRRGRTTADRIAAIHRYGDPVTDQHRTDARLLLESLLLAAGLHGVGVDDFDGAIDLPGGCVDVILAKSRRENRATPVFEVEQSGADSDGWDPDDPYGHVEEYERGDR